MGFHIQNIIISLLFVLVTGCNGIKEADILDRAAGISDRSTLEITPSLHTIFINDTQQFIASGGYPPYIFSLLSGTGSVTASGLYLAPSTIGTATIRVTDSKGATRDALVVTEVEVSITPSSRKINVGQSFQFATAGGTSPYTYSIVSGNSTVASDGIFTAAATPEFSVVRVTDAFGNFNQATIEVGNGPIISPVDAYVHLSGTYQFTSTSGTAPLTWSLITGPGSVSSSGLYTAPATPGEATVRVMDINGFYSDAIVNIFKQNLVTAGSGHTCVLKGDTNKVKCWGLRHYGATGDDKFVIGDELSDMGDALQPVKFATAAAGTQPTVLAMSQQNGCAIMDDNLTRCWGYGPQGQNGSTSINVGLYYGDSANVLPVPTEFSNPMVDLARKGSGDYFHCGVYLDGTAKCWGHNVYGQLGQDNQTPWGYDLYTNSLMNVSPINLGQDVLKIETGSNHACAILADRNVKCWGYGGNGQLGNGSTTNIGDSAGEMAAITALDFPSDVMDISLGGYNSCVLLADGGVRCWGYNLYGELGRGNGTQFGDDLGEDVTALTPINLGTGRTAVKIDSGYHFNCALLDNARLKCWGYNAAGQLGQEDTLDRGNAPGQMGDSLPYVFLGTGRTVVDFWAGMHNACAKLDNDEIKCWGYNDKGQLGSGNLITQNVGDGGAEMGDNLAAINFGTGAEILQMSVGITNCALVLQNGNTSIKCVGDNLNGALGTENNAWGDEPTERKATAIDLGTTKIVKRLSSGGNASCAQFTDDTAKCWGANTLRTLGTNAGPDFVGNTKGTMGTNLSYVTAGSGVTINKIELSPYQDYTSCGIFDGSYIKCWGFGGYATLGQDDYTNRYHIPSNPSVNLNGRLAKDMSTGHQFSCALMADGKVKCWGYSNYGQLGQGNTTTLGGTEVSTAAIPDIDLGTGFIGEKICSGHNHTCALNTAGKVKCWGYNYNGELGAGHYQNIGDNAGEMGNNLPFVDLGSGRTVKKMICAGGHTCTILDNDKLKCWGYNAYGQLGLGNVIYYGQAAGQMGNNLPYVNLGTGRKVIDVAGGSYNTCAVLDNNDVKCWGYNAYGQLGLGSNINYGDNLGEFPYLLLPLDLD